MGYNSVAFLLISVFIISCITPNSVASDNLDMYLSFGTFGGFAGSYSECRIYPNGTVYHFPRINSRPNKKESLTEENFIQFKEILHSLANDKKTLSEPGNLNHFIRYHEDGVDKYEFLWEEGRSNPSQRVTDLFSVLNHLCSERNPIM